MHMKYRHYMTIEGVKYTFDYSNSPTFKTNKLLHPEDKTFYYVQLGDSQAEYKKLDSMYEVDKEGFYFVPVEDVTTLGSEPCNQ